MMSKIYYLTRSYFPYQKGGGPLMRKAAVESFQEFGWEVTVIMPNYGSNTVKIVDNVIQIPFKNIPKLSSILQRVGIYEDYLDKWVIVAFEYLKEKISNEDVVFATSGGELGTIKLGSLLKNQVGCKLVVNLRDPLDYSLVHGLKVNEKFHISREKIEKKYLYNSDVVITSSKSNQQSLQNKYSGLKFNIINNYFGCIKKIDISQHKKIKSNKLRIAYSGSMLRSVQKPEILFEAYCKIKDKNQVEIYFIGDVKVNNILRNISDRNIKFIDFLPHEQYLEFMIENIDVGFVSLSKDYYGACIPSKIYEYINLGLPILGALPGGDAIDLINSNSFGLAVDYKDVDGLAENINKLLDKKLLKNIGANILNNREQWEMKHKIRSVNNILTNLSC